MDIFLERQLLKFDFFPQPIGPPPDQSLDYADADYRALYDYGPVSYRHNKQPPPKPDETSAEDN